MEEEDRRVTISFVFVLVLSWLHRITKEAQLPCQSGRNNWSTGKWHCHCMTRRNGVCTQKPVWWKQMMLFKQECVCFTRSVDFSHILQLPQITVLNPIFCVWAKSSLVVLASTIGVLAMMKFFSSDDEKCLLFQSDAHFLFTDDALSACFFENDI